MIEIVTFRLRDGVELDAFRAVDAAVQQGFTYQQPGIVRRTTAAADDESWAVITQWYSADDADAARAAAASSDEVSAFDALIDVDTVVVQRFRPMA